MVESSFYLFIFPLRLQNEATTYPNWYTALLSVTVNPLAPSRLHGALSQSLFWQAAQVIYLTTLGSIVLFLLKFPYVSPKL